MENFWALACGDSDLYDDIDWCSGWHSPEHSAKKPWPLFPRRKRQKKTGGWGWSSELGCPRESPEAAAHLCVGGSKVWALSDVCTTVIICFKLFCWENNKIIICLSRQINWASVGGMRPSSELLFSFCFCLIGPTYSLVNLFIFSPTTTVGHSDVLPQ